MNPSDPAHPLGSATSHLQMPRLDIPEPPVVDAGPDAVGASAVVEVGPIAHGGHCVARHDGRVIFVRHALPGERVRVSITDVSHDRFWRADAVEVLQASPDRVSPPCPIAGPGLCGGCDLQHVALAAQRELKAQVVAEQLHRLAGIAWNGEVEALPDADEQHPGLGWRTRMRYPRDETGRLGLRAHRSHEVVRLPDGGCRIAVSELARPTDDPSTDAPGGTELIGVRPSDGAVQWLDADQTGPTITETVGERRFGLRADGFWQVHPAAASTLLQAVLDGLSPRPGESALDLYCGVGLFAAGLADAGCAPVLGVESGRRAVADATVNLAGVDDVRFLTGRVEQVLGARRQDRRFDRRADRRQDRHQDRRRDRRRTDAPGAAEVPDRVDLVVLDPPRAGAGAAVVRAVAARRPRRIAYVACDPAALARDLRTFADQQYVLQSLRAFDLFPMTHHVECVAIMSPQQTEEDTR